MRLIAGLMISGATLSATACRGDVIPIDSQVTDVVVLADGCYTFTGLPDSVFDIASDIDWPTMVRWRDRRSERGYPYGFDARGLDPDWRSLASPLGSGLLVGPDSVVLSWGATSYRLRVTESGGLSGVAVLGGVPAADIPDAVVGEVSATSVPCTIEEGSVQARGSAVR